MEQLKRPQSKARFKAVDSDEEEDGIVDLPVKKKKRIASNKVRLLSLSDVLCRLRLSPKRYSSKKNLYLQRLLSLAPSLPELSNLVNFRSPRNLGNRSSNLHFRFLDSTKMIRTNSTPFLDLDQNQRPQHRKKLARFGRALTAKVRKRRERKRTRRKFDIT